eukprot:gene26622-1366_t
MNTLRVWGGGVYMPDAWYDACDDAGILVYHDMMYAQDQHHPTGSAHWPTRTVAQEAEIRHQVRRVSHHPSIVLWAGCNECDVDVSRAVWPSCPGNGWHSGVDRLTARPDGSPLVPIPRGEKSKNGGDLLETHGPYQGSGHGGDFPTVNMGGFNTTLAPLPPVLSEGATGVGYANQYASEFGTVCFPPNATSTPRCGGGNAMAQRNYGCGDVIRAYFGDTPLNQTGEAAFKRQLYQCMLSQALNMKSWIEARRSTNEFGCLVWQLNEIWPTGGWGSLEYGTPVKGQ